MNVEFAIVALARSQSVDATHLDEMLRPEVPTDAAGAVMGIGIDVQRIGP